MSSNDTYPTIVGELSCFLAETVKAIESLERLASLQDKQTDRCGGKIEGLEQLQRARFRGLKKIPYQQKVTKEMSAAGPDLAEQLHKWAVEEMHFYSHGLAGGKLPTVEDFKVLCRGPSAAIWKWVTASVHSAETVKTVKGNLALKQSSKLTKYKVKYNSDEQYGDEKAKLLEERSNLTTEITGVLRDIGHLETEVNRLSHDIAKTEKDFEKQTTCINNTRRKTALLEAYCTMSVDTGAQYREYTKCINNRLNTARELAQKSLEPEQFYSKETHGHSTDTTDTTDHTTDTTGLESACCKNVRECCETVGSFLQETLKGSFGTDKTEFSRQKESLWQQVEAVTSNFSADQIVNALMTNTQLSSLVTKDMAAHVDIRRDAQKLRFKYEPSGEIEDLAAKPSLLKSVSQILQERNKEHFLKFVICQKYINEARNLEQNLGNVRLQIDKRIQKLFSQKNADLQVARTLIEAEIELKGYISALHSLTTETEKLKDMAERSYRERQELYTKHHKIQEFKDLTDKKQNLIQVLVKQNINSQSRLDAQIDEIMKYIERSLKSHQSKMDTMATKLTNCVDTEVQQFASLSLPYLMFSCIDNALKTAVLDLSIHHNHPAHIRESLDTVLQCLNFPSFQGPDMVLRSCLQLKCDIEDMLDRMDREKWSAEWRRKKEGGKDVASLITELCKSVQEQDEKQLRKSLPVLQSKLSKTATAISDCLHTKDVAQAWWTQPGQHCVPWISVDGHNLQHYLDRRTVLATSLRQMLVK